MADPRPASSGRAETLLALAVLAVLAILIVPVPAPALDVLLALSVAVALLMLLTALGLTRALDFSVFPSLLLIITLFRLSLNVATTRLILLRGGEGAGAAGHLIETFGRFAVGGSLVVGLVIFLILLVVNFAVITKGANRVSEVGARFTLDAMPGKQMSIDADLAAGIIDDREAKGRRSNLEREAEFFGAMDGASKFVRGDAIAGLAITAINLVGGLVAGLAPKPKAAEAKGPERVQDLLAVEALELEVGYALVPLIELAKGAELPGRVTALRKQLASELGVVVPSVHLRDNLRLDANAYRVLLRGMEIGRGVAFTERLMALDPSGAAPPVEGVRGQDPAFGLPAVWIAPSDRARAEAQGLTLVDPPSVVTTHLSELLRRNAYDLIGRQEVQELLAVVAKEAPKLVEDVVPGTVTLGDLVRVLRGLLREGVSIRDLRTILEAVADAAPRSKETAWLVEQSRRRLARPNTARIARPRGGVEGP